jgi:YD repeat-containing protein
MRNVGSLIFAPPMRIATINPLGLGNRSTTSYDAANETIASINPLGNRWTSVFDAAGRGIAQKDPLGRRTTTVYDAANESIASIDALGNPRNLPALDEREIIRWTRVHFRRTGKWPQLNSGAIHAARGETWNAIDLALHRGTRGLPGGSSLAQLLAVHGLKRNPKRLLPLSSRQILDWADAHFRRHGEWPSRASGRIAESPHETWFGIDRALRYGGDSLHICDAPRIDH